MLIEAVLLTGGKSSRMGVDKASLLIDGESMGERMARQLGSEVERVTVLGRAAINGCCFQPDEALHAGPLAALSRFQPDAKYVFVCACDLPLFDARLIRFLRERLDRHPSVAALVPDIDGHLQPLTALYRTAAFSMIQTVRAEGHESMMSWLDTLWVETIDKDDLRKMGIDPHAFRSVDTPQAFMEIAGRRAQM